MGLFGQTSRRVQVMAGVQLWARQHFECEEEEIGKKRGKKSVVCLLNSNLDEWHMTYFYSSR
ncbi:hypothetical protein NQ318_007611 [Aromia moschata]|uniref:Uncharacterized protein n=1 Tax=Aromia moschata TaxID=1265417 RepID=A0AAV8YBF2_9CUCU|nr:hypothetical protein NQ318_007611 [Aromia moschata]